jgi:hypothetical protein
MDGEKKTLYTYSIDYVRNARWALGYDVNTVRIGYRAELKNALFAYTGSR